ncbi:MAG: hypothetical protein LBH18_07565 [Spirochaetaceae bacterium]|jgi:hypothetical protein|nr:hypothetical protein [Spirochaetaceae bacterium]
MLINKQNKTDFIICAELFLIAFAIIFASSYSPFAFRRMHVDSSVYMTIAQGITRGQLPYVDFVDNKGPLAYLLSVPGLLLGKFTGVWVTELIFMYISVFFAYKTALFFSNKFCALLGMTCAFVESYSFFSVSAGTEEYSLPFLMASFYIFTKYYFSFSLERSISLVKLIILGACFACAVLIKLNMFPLWAGFCVIIFIESIMKRRFAALGKYIFGFCAGIIIIAIPVLLYLKLNGILDGFFYQVIQGGAAQGFSSASSIKQIVKNFVVVLDRGYSIIPLLMGIFWIITKYKHHNFLFYIGYTFSYILTLLFLSLSSGDDHYNFVLIPFFIPAITFIIETIYSAFSEVRKKKAALVLFLCVLCSKGMLNWFYDATKGIFDDSGKWLINAGRMIDENTNPDDKIISLGINGYIYPFTERKAASKYIYQGSGLDHFPGARKEFLSDILTSKPAIIAIFSADDLRYDYLPAWYQPVYELIDEEYRLLSDENGYYLFIRKDPES